MSAAPLHDQAAALLNEIDCRIEHGAESGGHLEYVRDRLQAMLNSDPGGLVPGPREAYARPMATPPTPSRTDDRA